MSFVTNAKTTQFPIIFCIKEAKVLRCVQVPISSLSCQLTKDFSDISCRLFGDRGQNSDPFLQQDRKGRSPSKDADPELRHRNCSAEIKGCPGPREQVGYKLVFCTS